MEEELICPYDPSHLITALRMPRHLLKCRKNHPFVDMAVCPFNGFHEVPPPELRYHMEHCPDKTLLERDMHLDLGRTRLKGYTELPKTRHNKLLMEGDDDELWEEDQAEDSFSFQRNRIRSRLRDEETSRLRLPKRGGTAARLASSLQALELSDNGNSTYAAPCNIRAGKAQVGHHHRVNYEERDTTTDCNRNDLVSGEGPLSAQSSRLSSTPPHTNTNGKLDVRHFTQDSTNIINEFSAENKNSDLNTQVPSPKVIALSRLEPVTAEVSPALRGLTGIHTAPKTQAFMLGRGRALPTFLSKSSTDNNQVGRKTVAEYSAAAAQSKRLMELARSLGRGRGIGRPQQASNSP